MRFFSKTLDKLKGAVRKTAQILNTDVRTLFVPGRQIDEGFLTELEEKFLQADLGVKNVEKIIEEVRGRWRLRCRPATMSAACASMVRSTSQSAVTSTFATWMSRSRSHLPYQPQPMSPTRGGRGGS